MGNYEMSEKQVVFFFSSIYEPGACRARKTRNRREQRIKIPFSYLLYSVIRKAAIVEYGQTSAFWKTSKQESESSAILEF